MGGVGGSEGLYFFVSLGWGWGLLREAAHAVREMAARVCRVHVAASVLCLCLYPTRVRGGCYQSWGYMAGPALLHGSYPPFLPVSCRPLVQLECMSAPLVPFSAKSMSMAAIGAVEAASDVIVKRQQDAYVPPPPHARCAVSPLTPLAPVLSSGTHMCA